MNYANHVGWSDIKPYEIIKRNTERKLTIRSMTCEQKHTFEDLGFVQGGFLGHCSTQSNQEWEITSNPDGYVVEIRMNKKGEWKDKHGGRYRLSENPVKFYDYNF